MAGASAPVLGKDDAWVEGAGEDEGVHAVSASAPTTAARARSCLMRAPYGPRATLPWMESLSSPPPAPCRPAARDTAGPQRLTPPARRGSTRVGGGAPGVRGEACSDVDMQVRRFQ